MFRRWAITVGAGIVVLTVLLWLLLTAKTVKPVAEVPQPQHDSIVVSDALGCTIEKGTEGPNMLLVRAGDDWSIEKGLSRISSPKSIHSTGVQRINRLYVRKGFCLVKVKDTAERRLVGKGRPLIKDVAGSAYPAVGYLIKDRYGIQVRYTPDRPLPEMPEISDEARDKFLDRFTLFFLVPEGTRMARLFIGDAVLEDWTSSPFRVDSMQNY